MLEIPTEYVIAKFQEYGYKVSHDKNSDVYNSCCPICREGKSWGRKKRCYYVTKEELIYCHNCGWSSRPYNWIKEVSGMDFQEIKKEIQEGDFECVDIFRILEEDAEKKSKPSLPEESINLFDPVQIDNFKDNKIVFTVWEYLKSRRLNTAINRPDAFYTSLKDFTHKNRLIIPFKNVDGKIVFYQSRKVFEWDHIDSYMSKKDGDKILFNIDKVSPEHDTIYIFEGPLDACFVRNSVALGGITKNSSTIFTFQQQKDLENLKFYERIFVMDSQWQDKTAREKTNILIEEGHRVFIWPEKLGKKFKDFNQMCIALEKDEITHKFIKNNSHSGFVAKIKVKLLESKL